MLEMKKLRFRKVHYLLQITPPVSGRVGPQIVVCVSLVPLDAYHSLCQTCLKHPPGRQHWGLGRKWHFYLGASCSSYLNFFLFSSPASFQIHTFLPPGLVPGLADKEFDRAEYLWLGRKFQVTRGQVGHCQHPAETNNELMLKTFLPTSRSWSSNMEGM